MVVLKGPGGFHEFTRGVYCGRWRVFGVGAVSWVGGFGCGGVGVVGLGCGFGWACGGPVRRLGHGGGVPVSFPPNLGGLV